MVTALPGHGAGPSRPAAARCRGCGAGPVRRVADLGEQPSSDDYPLAGAPRPDRRWPLELWWCPACTLVQLGPAARPAGEQPAAAVPAVESATSRRHARDAVASTLADRPELAGGTVREFASHHGGSWLGALAEHGCRGVPDGAQARLVLDVHALAHEPGIGAALAGRAAALAPGGVLVVEHHHLLPLVSGLQFDTVRHGHWSYLSLTTLHTLAPRFGLVVIQAVPEPVFGGSLRVVLAAAAEGHPIDESVPRVLAAEAAAGLADGSGLESFGSRARQSASALRAFLEQERAAGRRVLGYGAPSKAAVLLGVAGAGPRLLEFTVDAAPAKHGRTVPGCRLPIRPVEDLLAARPDTVLVLTWDIAGEVVAQLEEGGGWGARYVVPVPLVGPVLPPADGAGGPA